TCVSSFVTVIDPLSYLITLFLIFFIMCGPPPDSTLFPYTTLFRSRRGPAAPARAAPPDRSQPAADRAELPADRADPPPDRATLRSEEHTSELQSRRDLVCRLLLEKKKKHKIQLRHIDNITLTSYHH